ncbi:MAG: glycosyltransferase family 4 protein [Dehalobacter sp.]|nr:glycosyltransferase family 4 protein [Dehalobacter sp.]
MKIGFLVDTLSIEKGTGIARYSNNLISRLQKSGFDVDCIFPNRPEDPVAGMFGHTVKLPYKIFINRSHYDIFHANSPITGIGLPLTNKPKIITYHDLASILYQPEAKQHVRTLAPYFYKIGKYCDTVISNSTQTKEELVRYLNFPQDKIVVINLGVDDKFFPIQKNQKNHKNDFIIGYVGAISPRKRVDYLIKVLKIFKKRYEKLNIRLVICGKKTSYHEQIIKMARDLDVIKFIEFRSFVPDDCLNETYNSFDVLIIPSEWEGFGIPILEAQKCGIPTIIRENVHIPAEVSECCLKCKDEKEIANQVYELLTDNEKYHNISKMGIEYSNRFTWDKMVNETIDVYNKIL